MRTPRSTGAVGWSTTERTDVATTGQSGRSCGGQVTIGLGAAALARAVRAAGVAPAYERAPRVRPDRIRTLARGRAGTVRPSRAGVGRPSRAGAGDAAGVGTG